MSPEEVERKLLLHENKISSLYKLNNKKDRWISEHDGRINAWWATQHQWNKDHAMENRAEREKVAKSISDVGLRMTALEKKVAVIVAIAALAGSFLGKYAESLI
jgi:hypothetical protein